jgi:predicted RNA-binding Zn ribbon-like protein
MTRQRSTRKSPVPETVRRDGALCATFVNTASRKRGDLVTYADLLAWGQKSGALSAADAERLGRAAGELPAAAEAVARQARELRDCLQRVLLAIAARRAPDAADLETVAAGVGAVLPNRRLVPDAGGRYRWAWDDRGGDELDRMLWPVLESAAEVLTSKAHRGVRQCAADDCDLLFVDRSPGSLRRWCSPRPCGSRHRSLKHYHAKVKPWQRQIEAEVAARLRAEAQARAKKAKPPTS